MSATRFLVTGGSGFIGAALVRRLVEGGHHVSVLDNNSRGDPRRLKGVLDDIDFIPADIRDEKAVTSAAANVDVVVHLAFVNGTRFFYSAPELVLDVGVRGILNVLAACRAHDVDRLIVASSSEVYQSPSKIPTDESAPLVVPDVHNPRYSYGAAKLISEVMAINYTRKDHGQTVIFRPHNIYGPDMGWDHVLPQLITRAVALVETTAQDPVPFPLQGDGSQTRSFMFIDDCADALMTLIEEGEHLGIYHVGNPEERSIKSVAEKIFELLKREVEIIPGPTPAGETARRVPDTTRLNALGFKPEISFDQGLVPTFEWYANNRDLWPADDDG
ncbi:MAG TPA: NAD-dependent epimerase/dehydratase family protein [Actinomycetota bacterium]|nr:NAD-dependent epimerase/dehydratase family protein [Actinomycetota bacterium]